MGGTLVALQAFASYKRSRAMENTVSAQLAANRQTERAHLQERLKSGVDHLGHESAAVRVGGAYELVYLAQDNSDLRQTVLDILCAYVRSTTGSDDYRRSHSSKPSAEIQNLLHVMFRKKRDVFRGLDVDLEGCWLNGADLRDAGLAKAVLTGAYLRGANFWRARLQGAVLWNAQLQGADFMATRLQGADLRSAGLQCASLPAAQLQGTLLWGTGFQGADLTSINLQGARATSVESKGLKELEFENYAFARRLREGGGFQSDLSEVVFEGGLSQEEVDKFVVGLPDEHAEALREALEWHCARPASRRLPDKSRAFLGAYTTEEAEQWIAESDV